MGHLVNAVYTWGIAQATGGRVVLRIEDHDHQRSSRTFESHLLEDLERLGLLPDTPDLEDFRGGATPWRQSDSGHHYEAALATLRAADLVYACGCARSTYAAWAAEHGRPWKGPGCPGGCRTRDPGMGGDSGLRLSLGGGAEAWDDLLAGPVAGEPAASGDLLLRDRLGNWTYGFCVVVDDIRHGIDLVIRGHDLLEATPAQLRLGRLLGRKTAARFLHHPLVRDASGRKLSKAQSDASVRSMLDGGSSPPVLLGLAARLAGLQDEATPVAARQLGSLLA